MEFFDGDAGPDRNIFKFVAPFDGAADAFLDGDEAEGRGDLAGEFVREFVAELFRGGIGALESGLIRSGVEPKLNHELH